MPKNLQAIEIQKLHIEDTLNDRLKIVLLSGIIGSLLMFVFSAFIQSFLITTIVHTMNVIVNLLLFILAKKEKYTNVIIRFILFYYFFMFIGNWSSLNMYIHSTRMLAIYLAMMIQVLLKGKKRLILQTLELILILLLIGLDMFKGIDVPLNEYIEVIIQSGIIGTMILVLWRQVENYFYRMRTYYERISLKDPLTNINNIRKFHMDIESIENDYLNKGQDYSIGIFDINGFKKLNDSYGHQTGDLILRTFVDLISSFLGYQDRVYRYGGDEFILVFSDSDIYRIEKFVSDVNEALDQAIDIDKELIQVQASFGYAHRKDLKDGYELIKKADQAMYLNKKARRGRTYEG